MKIAQIAPLYEAVPPKLYGGTERVIANLTDALVDLGHDVTIFASAETRTKARLVSMRERALRLDPSPLKLDTGTHLSMLYDIRERADEFDVLHFHLDHLHFPFFESVAQRTVTTLHSRLDFKDMADVYRRWSSYPLVAISASQRRQLPFANWLATVHHGLPAKAFAFSPRDRGYLVFLGRISPEKRLDRAIQIAEGAQMPLKVAAKIDFADKQYFETTIEPMLSSPVVEFVGEISDREKSEFVGGALALLFPIDWPEPFGLVMIESMACGTPVIAWDNGAVSEVVEDGVTGFIVNSISEAIEAVKKIPTIDRRRCRAEFERRFSATRMAKDYARLYAQLSKPLLSDSLVANA